MPLEAHALYGEDQYFEIWKAAAEHGLPIVVHADRAGGVLPAPTSGGYPQYFLEEYSQQPLYSIAHFCSLLASGVFARLPSLVFVLADGGFDYLQTLMWRMDKEWRSARGEVPWVEKSPTLYLADHVRFIVHRSDGPEDPDSFARFVELNDLASVLMYGSNYPSWDYLEAASLSDSLTDAASTIVMADNACKLYGLPLARRVEGP